MAERPAVRARVLSRREISTLTSDPRLMMALEAIFGDVAGTLPDSVLALAVRVDGMQGVAESAAVPRAVADDAMDAAEDAQALALSARGLALQAGEQAGAAASELWEWLQSLHSQIGALRDEMAALSRRLDDLETGPTR